MLGGHALAQHRQRQPRQLHHHIRVRRQRDDPFPPQPQDVGAVILDHIGGRDRDPVALLPSGIILLGYADLSTTCTEAVTAYAADVKSGDFPNSSESFLLPKEEESLLQKHVGKEKTGAGSNGAGEVC